MKPVDSGEGKKRDIEDADAPELDGFTILDGEPDPPVDSDTAADEDTTDKNPSDEDTAGAGNNEAEDSNEAEDRTELSDKAAGSGKDAEEKNPAAEADDSEAGNDDSNGELSFDEWLAAAEIPTDDPDKAADDGTRADGKGADADGEGPAAATGRGRKKNRRSRRSRKKAVAADQTNTDKSSADKTSADKTSADKASADKAGVDQASTDQDSADQDSADKTSTEDASAANADQNEVVGTSMSEIMAELLAAAEQSSLERPDNTTDALDTEVELDPEATSEFASTGQADSPKAVSAAMAAAKANSPINDESADGEAKEDSASAEVSKADDDAKDLKSESEKSEPDKSSKPADGNKKDADKSGNDKATKPGAKESTAKESVTKDTATEESKEPDVKDPKNKDSKNKDSKDERSEDQDSKDDKPKDEKSEDQDSKDDKSKDKEPKDEKSEDQDSKDDKSKDKEPKDDKSKDQESKDDKPVASATSPVESKTASPTVAPLRRPEKSSNVPTAIIAVVASIVGLYAILVVGWALDSAAHSGEPMRGVRLANVAVGGSNEEDLGEVFDTLDADLEAIDLTVSVDDVDINTDPFSLGVRHDREPMIDEALDARRGGFIAFRPIRWLFHLFTSEDIPAQYTIDEALAADGAQDIITPELDQPVEPEIELRGSQMALVPGKNGDAVDPDEIVDQLPGIVDGPAPYELALTAKTAAPELTDDAVTAVVDEINEQTEQPILAQVLDQEAEVSPRTLKTWMVLEDEDGEPSWSIDEELALEDLKPLFPALGSEDQQARFSVVDGEPIIIPASETVICCEEGTLVSLGAAIKRRVPDPIEPPEGSPEDAEPIQQLRRARLEPAITGNDEGVAELESLGIVEEISTFTTPHACCQNRVINIQRFADLTQGVIIRPGEEFSLNEFVGQRTRENGFVADGAIVLGNFEPQVGGGISQYATTFFNASFFAGIEFLEYQSHSIYISRYPRGREATISWRRPDLKVLNNTDYGILVWNEYTDTSITVTFYSTKNREVEALPLLRSSDRQCRIDITPRVITFEDGTTQEDSVRAIYRPGQGLDCNGNSTTPEEDPPPPANNSAPEPPAPDPDPDDGDGEVLPPGE